MYVTRSEKLPFRRFCTVSRFLIDFLFLSFHLWARIVTQLTFTCSKSTKETLEKGVKYGEISSKLTIKTPTQRH